MKNFKFKTVLAAVTLAAATFAAPFSAQANDFRNVRVATTSHPVKTVLVQNRISPISSLNRGFTTSFSTLGFNQGFGNSVSSLDLQIAGLVRQLNRLKYTGRRSFGYNRQVRNLELRIADLRRQRIRSLNVRRNGLNVRNIRRSF